MTDLNEQIRMLVTGGRGHHACADVNRALLAVLELHKPVRQGAGAKVWHNCAHCQNANWGGPDVDWPCETVEAVAKELGIEAP